MRVQVLKFFIVFSSLVLRSKNVWKRFPVFFPLSLHGVFHRVAPSLRFSFITTTIKKKEN